MFSQIKITLNIETDSIRAIAIKGNRIEQWGSVPLEPGVVTDGLILQPKAATRAIDTLFREMGINTKKVILSITGLRATFRILSLPHLNQTLLDESVRRGAKREMPVPIDELYLSWQTIRKRDDEQDVFVLGMPQELVDAGVETLTGSGIKCPVIDFKPLALSRLVDHQNAVIIDLESDGFGITLVSNGIPSIIRTITPREEDSIQDEHVILRLNEEISRIIEFHNREQPRNQINTDIPVFLTGKLASDISAAETIMQGIDYHVESLDMALKYPPDFPVATYAVNIGLAIRQEHKRARVKNTRDLSLNVLPERYRPRQVPIRYAFLCLIPILIIGGLYPAHHAASNTAAETSNLQVTLDDLNYQLEQITRVTSAQDNIEDTIQRYESQAIALKNELEAITTSDTSYGNTAQLIIDALPPDSSLTSIKFTTSQIVLQGNTNSLAMVISYAKTLENLGICRSVFITDLANSFSIVMDL